MPGRGLLPAQPLPGSGGGGAQQSAADGPLASWARRLGVRAGRLQPCAGAGTAPRPAPGSGVPAPRSEGLPVLAPPARTRTGAGTRVSEEKTRRKNATASWNTFPRARRVELGPASDGRRRLPCAQQRFTPGPGRLLHHTLSQFSLPAPLEARRCTVLPN